MRLPPKEFSVVVEALRTLSARNEPTDQRGAIRMNVTTSIQIHLIENQSIARSYKALTIDISVTGAQIIQTIPAQIGQIMLMTFPLRKGSLHIRSVVVHCHELADELLRIGVAFESAVTTTAMAELVAAAVAEETRLRKAILE